MGECVRIHFQDVHNTALEMAAPNETNRLLVVYITDEHWNKLIRRIISEQKIPIRRGRTLRFFFFFYQLNSKYMGRFGGWPAFSGSVLPLLVHPYEIPIDKTFSFVRSLQKDCLSETHAPVTPLGSTHHSACGGSTSLSTKNMFRKSNWSKSYVHSP